MDTNYNSFLSNFLNSFHASFPIVTKQQIFREFSLKWITQGIIISSKHRRILYAKCKETNNIKSIQEYNTYNFIYKKVIKKAKQLAIDGYVRNSVNKCRAAWNIIRNETGAGSKKLDEQNIEDLLKEFDTVNAKSTLFNVAELFNNYFVNIAEKTRDLPPSLKKCAPQFKYFEVT